MDNEDCGVIMMLTVLFFMGFVVGFLLLYITLNDIEISNGQHYFCDGQAYLDVAEPDPLEIRFTCAGSEDFEITFTALNNPEVLKVIREAGDDDDSKIGVVLNDGQLRQLYLVDDYVFSVQWPSDN